MSSFDPERHCQCESKVCPLQHPLQRRAQAAPSSPIQAPSVRCDGCGAPTTPDPVREFRTVGGTVYHACSDVCLGHIDDAVSSGRPLATPTDALPWVVHTGAVATTAWCVSFEDAVRFATQAGPGARIEGPWKELLTLRPEVALTEAASSRPSDGATCPP